MLSILQRGTRLMKQTHVSGKIALFSMALWLFSPALRAQQKSEYQLEMERQWKLHPTLAIGASAPDFVLTGTDGRKHSLKDWRSSPVLAVMFICNDCPASQLYEDRIKKMVSDYRGSGVQF